MQNFDIEGLQPYQAQGVPRTPLLTAKNLSSEIQSRKDPVIVIYNQEVVAYNDSAAELWKEIEENMESLLGENIEEVQKKYDLKEEHKCFYTLCCPKFTSNSYIHVRLFPFSFQDYSLFHFESEGKKNRFLQSKSEN